MRKPFNFQPQVKNNAKLFEHHARVNIDLSGGKNRILEWCMALFISIKIHPWGAE